MLIGEGLIFFKILESSIIDRDVKPGRDLKVSTFLVFIKINPSLIFKGCV